MSASIATESKNNIYLLFKITQQKLVSRNSEQIMHRYIIDVNSNDVE